MKPQTLYAYVSRGLLHPERGPSGSTFDRQEVARLARTARAPGVGSHGASRDERAAGGDPVFVTELTTIAGGRLWYRGRDAAELALESGFEEVAEWLWNAGAAPGGSPPPPWEMGPGVGEALAATLAIRPAQGRPVERLPLAVQAAALCDDLRHDLERSGVAVTGRSILSAMAACLPLNDPLRSQPGRMAERVWSGMTRAPLTTSAARGMEVALVLGADHELAPTTLVARVAAAFRADPYAVVLSALGPAGGSWQPGSTGAPSEVETLLAEAAERGVEKAVGDRMLRSGGLPHGFGMPLYPAGDPRAAALLDAIAGAPGWEVVDELVAVAARRGFPAPNFDLALGALAFCSGMVPGSAQVIFTIAKTAGWLAHAMEEYADPTRFRSRADYAGPTPELIGS